MTELLPPLPDPLFRAVRLGMTPNQSMAYTESEMRAYGEACAIAEREKWRKATGYALVVHPENTAMLNMLPEGQWVILQRKCVPSKGAA